MIQQVLSLVLVSSFLTAPALAQGSTPPGWILGSSTREALVQTYVFDSNFDEREEQIDSAPSAIGPWQLDLDLQGLDPNGVPVGRARSQQVSEVQRTELTFDLDISVVTAGNHSQEDAYGSSDFRIEFSTTERMRFAMTAQTAAALGYNRSVVDLHSVLAPTSPIATVASYGGFDPSSSGAFEGWLQPGQYVLSANSESLAGGSGAPPGESQSASCSGALRAFHQCDYDLDGDVDLIDRHMFLSQWALGLNPEATDFDGDGDRDTADASRFLLKWRRALRP
ncbi:MAG: hypothetical protein AAF368_00420 [Planctomycetota bacterium]